jgi:flagellar hook-associated protein 3 FlgL
MRVTTPLIYRLGVEAIARQQADLLKTQQHIASSKRMLTPSDDPIGAAQATTLTQAKARVGQYSANIHAAGYALAHAESVLGQAGVVLQAVRTHAIAAGAPALSDADRRSIATDLRAQLAQLVALANSQDGDGAYLFSGFATATQPFSTTASGVAYAGDGGQRALEVAPSRNLPISASGDRVFMGVPQGNGAFVASAATANTGTGVITPGTVVNPAALTGDTYRIQINVAAGVTTYDVIDVTTAAVVSSGNAYVDGGWITVAGMQVTIGGAPANGDQFTLAPSASQSVFATIANLIATLETPVATGADRAGLANGLNRALADVDQGLERILTVRAEMGAGMRELETLAAGNEGQQILHDQALSRLQDLDYNQALSDFARQQLALEAAQKSFIQVSGLTLFDFI